MNDNPRKSPVGGEIAPTSLQRVGELNALVAAARTRLAALEAIFTSEKAKVDLIHARIFSNLRPLYERRAQIEMTVNSRRAVFDALLRKANDAAADIAAEYERARERSQKEFDEIAAALARKHELTADEESELHDLWKRLVRLFHPDRFANDTEKQATYSKLTSVINHAKDTGDLATLREIAEDPDAFIRRQGWATLDFSDVSDVTQLEKLLAALHKAVEKVRTTLRSLRESADYELCQAIGGDDTALEQAIAKQRKIIAAEIKSLETEAARLRELLAGIGYHPK